MDVEQRYALVMRNADEIVTEDELRELLAKNPSPKAYIGFEPSGLVHMGWALVAAKIRDLIAAGFKVTIFWADWHAYINDKLGGDLENIRACARYMEDCFLALGIPREGVEFKYASEVLSDIKYWENVIKVAKVTSLSRVKRAMTIMGRSEDEAELDSSKLFYPILQATDIFCMDVDLAYAGIDQRRAHMLARDAAEKLGWKKPIALHTPLLPGLAGGNRMDPTASKMSKSKPDSNINIHDSPEDIRRKMKKAFCPMEKEEEDTNPVLMICKYIIFPTLGEMTIQPKFGDAVSFKSYEELTDYYFSQTEDGKPRLHPLDLKSGTADALIKCLEPVAQYFEKKHENYDAMIAVLKKLGKL
ncbi:MAG: tyrosine--tRNA ligase [Candidatus Methanomethylophilaceae archaeon]|nr:tyrosine--tRNA ligase [Candidatus Methanomethylophilaceae archaeon]